MVPMWIINGQETIRKINKYFKDLILEVNMKSEITREEVFKRLNNIEHPEIAATLIDLGMILDVTVNKENISIALALPTLDIPELVKSALVQSIRNALPEVGLKTSFEFFEMTPEAREKFFALSRANWKDTV